MVRPLTRLEVSNVKKGDRVILLEGSAIEENLEPTPAPAVVGEGDGEGEVSIDRKVGVVVEVIHRRLAVVSCKVFNKQAYPPSYEEHTVTVPLSCAFDLGRDDTRREYLLHCVSRSANLHDILSSGLGSFNMEEVYLGIAKHLVDYSQSLVIFSGYRQKTFSSVFCRHSSHKSSYWLQISKLPSPRIDSAVMKPMPGCVVFAGGVDDHPSVGSPLESVVSYDTLTDEWTKLPSMSIRRHGCCGVYYPPTETMYVFGGSYAELAASTRTMIETGLHAELAASTRAVMEAGLPFYESLQLKDWQGGGGSQIDGEGEGEEGEEERNGGRQRETRGWVPGEREREGLETTDRLFAACGIVDGKIVLAGGEVPRASSSVRNRYTFEYHLHTVFEVVASCEAFCPIHKDWHPLPSMECARVGAASCVWEGCLVVAGGQNEHKQALDSVEMFDGKSWTRLPDLNQKRFHASMTVWNGVLTIVGGTYGENEEKFSPGKVPTVKFTDMVEQYSPELGKWSICKNLRMPVAFHACVVSSLNIVQDMT